MTDRDSKQREYAELMETTASALWIRDLDALESAYSVIMERKRRENDAIMSAASTSASASTGSAGKVKKTMIVKRKVPVPAIAIAPH
jgi:hypothetical protein